MVLRGGSDSKLTVSQEIELIRHLQTTTYITAKTICQYIFGKDQIKYTVSGITKWLERNDFVYKAPKLIPGKLDECKQQQFIEYYQELVAAASTNEIVMFMNAVHPESQSQSVYGWMPKGETKTLAATNTQYRLHLNGAIDLSSMQIVTREYPTIDAQSIISFCTDLENSRVIIHYLPLYSPNLNPIERLWKVMREHVTYNKVYPKFADFTAAIRHFFADTVHSIQNILRARINDNFEVIRHNQVQLSS